MDAYIEKADDNTIVNKIPANVPEKQARVFLEYQVPSMPGLSVSGSAGYSGLRWVDGKNTAYIPAVRLYNAGIRYRPIINSHRFTINLNIANLFNTTYWAAYKPSGTVGLCLGAPRLISLSAKYEL